MAENEEEEVQHAEGAGSPDDAGDREPEAAGEEAAGGGKKRTSSRLWTPYSEPGAAPSEPPAEDARPAEDVSEEELRQRLEEALENITVVDVVIDFMVSTSSLAYRSMGLPHEVNEKHKDMEQARLAIDCIDALLKTAGDRLPEEAQKPLSGTLDNLKLNFVKES